MSGRDFLQTIIESKRRRLAHVMRAMPLDTMRERAVAARVNATAHALRSALDPPDRTNIIAEFKRASPSKGEIRAGASPSDVARMYEAGGAVAMSVLTEEDHFRGSLADLRAVREAVSLPVLRKDFIFDEYQVYETADARADALLLIVAALADEQLARLRRIAEDELRMDALVEVHSESELARALASGATLIGINNRNLRTFEVSLDTSIELARAAPDDALLVSESGLRTGDDLARLRALGFCGFLIGETLMRADDPVATLRALQTTRAKF